MLRVDILANHLDPSVRLAVDARPYSGRDSTYDTGPTPINHPLSKRRVRRDGDRKAASLLSGASAYARKNRISGMGMDKGSPPVVLWLSLNFLPSNSGRFSGRPLAPVLLAPP
ncbi:hypothetical protein BY996DRAFT_6551153 [Phakopsora pachyrhizi]|nr:hypothetical protein BY996DRAFT_6551153 [Phakopsora pachyrhizi]